jgi:hypothetical protein
VLWDSPATSSALDGPQLLHMQVALRGHAPAQLSTMLNRAFGVSLGEGQYLLVAHRVPHHHKREALPQEPATHVAPVPAQGGCHIG